MKKPLQIGLIMQGDYNWVGGMEYTKNIILALSSLPPEVRSTFELSLLCSQSLDIDFQGKIQPYLDHIYYQEIDLEPLTILNRLRWKLIELLIGQGSVRLDIFFRKINLDFVYPHFAKNESKLLYRSATWISDFQHKHLPQFFTKQEIKKRDQLLKSKARYASTIVLSSKTAESDFQRLFPESAYKSRVLSFRTVPSSLWYKAEPKQTQQRYSLPDRFFLLSNQFWAHKNHLVVFKALKLLHEKGIYPTVVCTGSTYDHRLPTYGVTIQKTIQKLNLTKQVHLLGLIPRFDQIQLMRRSLAVIQPSLFEGWSTIVEDARCLGKHIILSDIPVHLEQNPPKCIYFERHSHESLSSLLVDWWEHLLPGPDLEEETAKTNNIHEIEAFAYRFLEIAEGNS